MRCSPLIRLCLTLGAALAGSGAWAQQAADWAPAATYGGRAYQNVEELRSFYKLTTGMQPTRKGALATMGLGDTRVELGPGRRSLSIGGMHIELAYPLMRDAAGQLLISREDWVSWVDPILRPTYIAGRTPIHQILLDPGHGGHDEGATAAGTRESEITLQVARRLKDDLEKQGYRVSLTRSGDYFLSDRQRVDTANNAEAPIFISLHLNTGRSDYRGSRVYTLAPPKPDAAPLPAHAQSGRNAALAYALQSALVHRAGAVDAGCHHAHFSLLSSITCPAAWVELGYATHEQEGAALTTPAYQEALAQALAQGIITFINATAPGTQIPTQAPPPKIVVNTPPPTPKKAAPPTPPKKSSAAPPKKAKTGTPARRNSADSFRRGARDSRTRTR